MKHIKKYNETKASEYKAHLDKLKSDPEYAKEHMKKMELDRQEYWNSLKPFTDERSVPHLPNPLNDFYTNRIIELGGIPKDKLQDGEWYYGNYRNSTLGKWDANKQEFGLWRYKFGYYWDTCNHFQDENGYALFVPLRKANQEELESIKKIEEEKKSK